MASRTASVPTNPAVAGEVPDRLRTYNLALGLIHLVQAIIIAAISNDFKLPIVGSYLSGPPGSTFSEPDVIWNVPVGYAVALFLLLAAIDHLAISMPGGWGWYQRNLADKINYARWAE